MKSCPITLKKTIRHFVFVLSLILCITRTQGQNLVFRHLTVENGLSQNAVMAIAQDKRGFIWIGTRYGLNRFDGINFKVYKNNPANNKTISDNLINSLMIDDEGILWVATYNGLNKYNAEKDEFEQIMANPSDKNSLTSNLINFVYQDSKKNIWVGTKNGLNLLIDKKLNKFQSTFGSKHGSISSLTRIIYEGSDENLWIGTATELVKMSLANNIYQYQSFHHDDKNTASLSADYVTSITEDACAG